MQHIPCAVHNDPGGRDALKDNEKEQKGAGYGNAYLLAAVRPPTLPTALQPGHTALSVAS